MTEAAPAPPAVLKARKKPGRVPVSFAATCFALLGVFQAHFGFLSELLSKEAFGFLAMIAALVMAWLHVIVENQEAKRIREEDARCKEPQ